MEATVLHVDRMDRKSGKLLSRGVAIFDTATNPHADPIGPDGVWRAGEFLGNNESTKLFLDHCGAIYAGGVLKGSKECTDEILNRRRSLLLAARKILSVLDPAIDENWTKSQTLDRLRALRAPLPWDVDKMRDDTPDHSTLQNVRGEVEGLGEDEAYFTRLSLIRDRYRSKLAALGRSLPKME